jgi:hypothetical protein
MISPLDARWRFLLSRPLARNERDLIDTMPGFRASKKGVPWVEASTDGAWAAERMLHGFQIPFEMRAPEIVAPRPWGPEADEELKEMVRNSDVRNWLVGAGEVGPWELLPFQKEAIWFAIQRGGCGLLREEAGAGKTVQAAVVAGLSPMSPSLIITKAGSPVPQWCREIEKFLSTTAYELRARSKRRKKDGSLHEYVQRRQSAGERPVVVIGWPTLRVCIDELLTVSWGQVIFDESHYAKSPQRKSWAKVDGEWQSTDKSSQSAAAARIVENTPRRLCTTATAVPDRRRDLWGQFSLISPDSWGMTLKRFGIRYCAAHEGEYGIDTTGTSNTAELEARMKFFFHDVPKRISHGQLPPCRVEACYIPVEKQDKPATGFKREIKRLGKESAMGNKSASGELREVQLQEAATRKRSTVISVAETYAHQGRALLFTGRHRDCWELADAIQRKFKKARATRHIKVLCGVDRKDDGTFDLCSRDKRDALLTEYQNTENVVLVATSKAWGTSLDGLQCTDLLGIVMLPWSPGELIQWMGRITRLGQDRAATIMLFIAEQTVDDRVGANLMSKVPDAVRLGGNVELTKTRDAVLGLDDEDAMKELVRKITQGPPEEFSYAD